VGYDGLVILGKSEKPVYLLIEDKSAAIRDAKQLWGLDTFETQ
jgi:aldehyde:ferredoxin oxidoreductase